MNKKKRIIQIFNRIHELNVCGYDEKKVKRDIRATNINAKVMVIAEAMAPEQVRLSGVNYFYVNGKIGNTGRYLEKFLNLFDCTVYPSKKNCIYHTEIVHSFPGYVMKNGRKSIRRPNKKEIFESVQSNILSDEIELIRPKVLLLMGNTAYVTFYKYFLKRDIENNLTREIERISESGEYYVYDGIPVIPIQHSSGVNPRFSLMLRNQKLIDMIVGCIYIP